MNEKTALTASQQRLILHWGEMGNRWGINRTTAQIHALLYLSREPLDAERIQNTLGVARSNVSGCLRELQSWGIVRVVHVLGERRDHFEADQDPWSLLRKILDERKRREIDPVIESLHECAEQARAEGSPQVELQILSLLQPLELTSRWYASVENLSPTALTKFLRLGDKLLQFLEPKPDKASAKGGKEAERREPKR